MEDESPKLPDESPMYVKKSYKWDSSSDEELETSKDPDDPHNFNERFIRTHSRDFSTALAEIKNGRKCSCWSWYIYPVAPWIVNGRECGSWTNRYYALRTEEQAIAYLKYEKDGVNLRQNYVDIMKATLEQLEKGVKLRDLLGFLDDPKARSSFELFHRISKKVEDKELEELCFNVIKLIK